MAIVLEQADIDKCMGLLYILQIGLLPKKLHTHRSKHIEIVRPEMTTPSCTTPIRGVVDPGSVTIECELRYYQSDPYAVTLRMETKPTEPKEYVDWTFARSLLADGVWKAVGEGDVRIE